MFPAFFVGFALSVAPTWAAVSPQICQTIATSISNASDVYYPDSDGYTRDNSHWLPSSSQQSLCSVEPGTTEDVSVILSILGSTRTPFAIKGGGHSANLGFSSTNGVQIAMNRFVDVNYDEASQTVVIGTGLLWETVYAQLEEHGVSVVGGRGAGVGVAGLTLGGGFSWLTNQHGLTVDTVEAFELVKPNGDIVYVTRDSEEDLFFALKGGFNNFGIVTRFTLKTFPQGQVWGGAITFTDEQINAVSEAAAKFSSDVTDPKAGMYFSYNFILGQLGAAVSIFYDGPTPPAGIFDDFLAIPYATKDVEPRSLLSLILAAPSSSAAPNIRGMVGSVPLIENSPTLIEAALNETLFWGNIFSFDKDAIVQYTLEPFQPNILSFGADTAYPPTRSVRYLPSGIYFGWTLPQSDDLFLDGLRKSTAHLRNVAVADGQSSVGTAAAYPNYAMYDTPVELLYGDNVPRLQAIKATVDPFNIMGLAGGFKL